MNTIDPYPEKLMSEALSKYSTPYGQPNPETYAYLAGASAMNGSAGVPSSILRMNDTWPLSDVLKHLIEGTQILLEKKNYDGPTYEQMEICVKVGNEIRELLSQASPSPLEAETADKNRIAELEAALSRLKISLESADYKSDGVCRDLYDQITKALTN